MRPYPRAPRKPTQQVAQAHRRLGKSPRGRDRASVSTIASTPRSRRIGLQGTSAHFVDLSRRTVSPSRRRYRHFVAQLDGYDGHVAWSGDGTPTSSGTTARWRRSSRNQSGVHPELRTLEAWIRRRRQPSHGGHQERDGHTYDALTIAPPGTKVRSELFVRIIRRICRARARLRRQLSDGDATRSPTISPVNGFSFPYRDAYRSRAERQQQ